MFVLKWGGYAPFVIMASAGSGNIVCEVVSVGMCGCVVAGNKGKRGGDSCYCSGGLS